jgi:hypothetical protein
MQKILMVEIPLGIMTSPQGQSGLDFEIEKGRPAWLSLRAALLSPFVILSGSLSLWMNQIEKFARSVPPPAALQTGEITPGYEELPAPVTRPRKLEDYPIGHRLEDLR